MEIIARISRVIRYSEALKWNIFPVLDWRKGWTPTTKKESETYPCVKTWASLWKLRVNQKSRRGIFEKKRWEVEKRGLHYWFRDRELQESKNVRALTLNSESDLQLRSLVQRRRYAAVFMWNVRRWGCTCPCCYCFFACWIFVAHQQCHSQGNADRSEY